MKKILIAILAIAFFFPQVAYAAPTMIADNTGTPSVYNNRIVYKDMNANWQIKMLDLNTSTTYNITNDANNYEWPKIYGNRVIYHQMEWVEGNYSNSDLRLADITDPNNPVVDNLAEPNGKATYTWFSDIYDNYIFYHSSNVSSPYGSSNFWRYNIISSTSEWGQPWNFHDLTAFGNSSLIYSNDSQTEIYYFTEEPVTYDKLLGPLAAVIAPSTLRWPVTNGTDIFLVYSPDGVNYGIWRANTDSGLGGEVHSPSPSTKEIRHLDFHGDKLVWEETVTPGSHWQSFYETQDVTAPTVNITSPTSGKYVKGTITVNANASDASGIQFARLRLGETTVQTIMGAGPFSFSFNTTTTTNGSKTLAVRAYDNFMVGIANLALKIDNYRPKTYAPRRVTIRRGRTARLYWKAYDPYTGSRARIVLKLQKKYGRRYRTVKNIRYSGYTVINKTRYARQRMSSRGTYRLLVYARDRAGNTQRNVARNYIYVK